MGWTDAPSSINTGTTDCGQNGTVNNNTTYRCIVPDYTSTYDPYNYSYNTNCTATPTKSCPTCFSLNSAGQCVFSGGTNAACYTCPTNTLNYTGTSYQIYSTTVVGNQCLIKEPGVLNATSLSPSPWGNDSLFDGNPTVGLSYLLTKLGNVNNFTPRDGSVKCYPGKVCTSVTLTSGPSNGTAVTAGAACPAGYYCTSINLTPIVCPLGTYCPAGASLPTACSSGSYCSAGSSSQTPCPAGYYCQTGNLKTPCLPGTYSASTGASSVSTCLVCPAGSYCPSASTSATTCPAGNFCPLGSGALNQCTEGYYCPTTQAHIQCPAGVTCPVGTSSNYGIVCDRTTVPTVAYNACAACPNPAAYYIWDAAYASSLSTVILPPATNITGVYEPIRFRDLTVNNFNFIAGKSIIAISGGLKITGTVSSFTASQLVVNVNGYSGAGTSSTAWTITPYGCDTVVKCQGHMKNSTDFTKCEGCPLPAAGYIWAGSSGCETVQCTDGLLPNADLTTCTMAPSKSCTRMSVTPQSIQVDELTITSSPPPAFTNKPFGLSSSFTLSMSIKCATIPTNLTQIIGMGPHPGFPGVWFHPSYPGKLMVHMNDRAIALPSDKAPPENAYFNFTIVYSPTNGTSIYLNGVQAASDATINTFTWPVDVSDWRWNQQAKTTPVMNVKDVYWFNQALTASDINILATSSQCVPGQTCGTNGKCTACAPGTACATCPTSTPLWDGVACMACSSGQYWNGTECTACANTCLAGTYETTACTLTTNRACTTCTAGYYCPSNGMTSQIQCQAGYYCPTAGMTSQTQCTAGNYCPTAGMTSQTQCTAGNYCPTNGMTSQIQCQAGYYCPTAGMTSQTQCTAGNYCPTAGMTSQTQCTAGNYCPTNGMTSQTQCTAGNYCPTNGMTSQTQCTNPSGMQYTTASCTTTTNTQIATQTCSSNQYASGFNRGAYNAVGSAGTCTACSNPTSTQIVSMVCSSTTDTLINPSQACSGWLDGFRSGSYNSTGWGGTCFTCSQPSATQYVTAVCTATTNTAIRDLTMCPAGQYLSNFSNGSSTQVGSGGTCVNCAAGTYCPGGIYSSSTCPAGKYCPGGVAINCSKCTSLLSMTGSYASKACTTTTDTECSYCPGGYYCPGDENKYQCSTAASCGTTGVAVACTKSGDRVCNGVCNCPGGTVPYKSPDYKSPDTSFNFVCCPPGTTSWAYYGYPCVKNNLQYVGYTCNTNYVIMY